MYERLSSLNKQDNKSKCTFFKDRFRAKTNLLAERPLVRAESWHLFGVYYPDGEFSGLPIGQRNGDGEKVKE